MGVASVDSLHKSVHYQDEFIYNQSITVYCEGHLMVLCVAGIQVSSGVASHGLALNCNTDLSWFQHITPCGVEDKNVTSLTDLCRRTWTPEDVQPLLEQNLAHTLGFELAEISQRCIHE